MDPLSQGVVGAATAQSVSKRNEILAASAVGFLSGLAADLDVFIRSEHDPLLFLEYHRQFTHSLIFMPVGGLICALVFWFFIHIFIKKSTLSFTQVYLYSFAGYATHALLDSCTSYGTQLFWPFSSERIAWNNVSIIDPLFTLPILLLIAFALFKRCRLFGQIAAIYAVSYLCLGLVQEHRAFHAAQQLAQSRGHQAIDLTVKPSFMNLIVWKSIYEHEGHYYVDAIRVANDRSFYLGESIQKLELDRDFPWLDPTSQQAIDIERFRWFSDQHIAVDINHPNRIIDMRYSMLPNQLDGLWGIDLDQDASHLDHVRYVSTRRNDERKENIIRLWQMVKGVKAITLPEH
jgi:inner membrane protein